MVGVTETVQVLETALVKVTETGMEPEIVKFGVYYDKYTN